MTLFRYLLSIAFILIAASTGFSASYSYMLQLPTGGYGFTNVKIMAIVGTDSSITTTVSSFPYTGTLTLNDTCLYTIRYRWMTATDTAYSDVVVPSWNEWNRAAGTAASSNIASIKDSVNKSMVKLDSVWWAAGNKLNSFSRQGRSGDIDTLYFGVGSTIVWKKLYFHIGSGLPGRWPDSVKVIAGP